jgi:hypothetical protein
MECWPACRSGWTSCQQIDTEERGGRCADREEEVADMQIGKGKVADVQIGKRKFAGVGRKWSR